MKLFTRTLPLLLGMKHSIKVKMQRTNSAGIKRPQLIGLAAIAVIAFGVSGRTCRAVPSEPPSPAAFAGEKTTWHEGFDRYDFIMDDATGAVTPIVAPTNEVRDFSIDNAIKDGKRRCVVIVPKEPAPGNPWSWRGCYWDHQPQTEIELLKRGFHVAWVAPDAGKQGKAWDAWYKFLTDEHGLSKKAAFIGMSKGGVNEFNWGVVNPDKVACIYADNPALYEEDFAKIPELARHDVPVLEVGGTEDGLLRPNALAIEDIYHQAGGLITVIIKEGHAHHPHSLQNPKLIADWIEQHMTPSTANRPAFVNATYRKRYYYSLEPSYIFLKEENTYATARGPGFTECYDRYDASIGANFRVDSMSIVVPKTVAQGKPWVLTGDAIERDSTVEQALLAKGYHIVIVGMERRRWDDTYKLLVDHGFSSKPVLKGTGPKAGEAYAWAIANPGKVSCIYARNPYMHSLQAGNAQPIDNLAALAKANVPVMHDCGASDPWLESQTRAVERRYKELGGQITVIIREGEGHFPLSPKNPKPVVEFIIEKAAAVAAASSPSELVTALEPTASAVSPQKGQASDDIDILKDIEIGKVGSRVLHADIARPKTRPAVPMPAVMWIHGGGWSSGSHHEMQQTVKLASHGYLVLSVEYRLVDEEIWPAQIEDCKLGVRWLRENAAKYNVNPDRIGCWGASAGGHLAALMGVTGDKPDLEGKGGSAGFSSRVQAVVDFCGPTDFKGRSDVTRKMAGGTFEQKTDVFKQMSPLQNVNPKACPFLIVNGEKDTTVPLFHAQLMTEALKQANVPVELIIVKNAGHGYTFVAPPGGPPAQPSPDVVDAAVLRFLDANLKK